jgi:hypothetical protein
VFASYMTFLPEGSHLRIVTDLYPKITAKVWETETRGWFVVVLTPLSVPPDCTGKHV